MKALIVERSVARFAAARIGSGLGKSPGGTSSPLRLVDREPPVPPGDDWRVVEPILAGICGSDLATISGMSSRWFEPIVSFPFVPGHEVVGRVQGEPDTRVVLAAVLGCEARSIDPPCEQCKQGQVGSCERIAFGDLQPGLQTGFCHDTGGGWSNSFVAHASQLRVVPEDIDDNGAVMVEPTACAVHAALSAQVEQDSTVAVLGAGTLGLCVTAALKRFAKPGQLLVSAKHDHQQRLATRLGATSVTSPDAFARAIRRSTGSLAVGKRLTSGADIVFDCVGSAQSLSQCLDVVRPKGTVVLVGMPSAARIDLTALWQREISLVGAYAYGSESLQSGKIDTFELAFELVAGANLGRLVSARYPLERYEEALAHAAGAGKRGAVKVVFEPGAGRRFGRKS